MEHQFKYFAFISYSHKDEKQAIWLHKKLESYRLPVGMQNNLMHSKFLRPIFRDQDELNTGILKEEINCKLKESKYLIVVCSPNSAQSRWVSSEVDSFIKMGRLEYIVPYIIDGASNSVNGFDCYPTALREYVKENPDRELLGVNIYEVGREKSVIRVVSRILDVGFDTLWKRHEKARRRRVAAWLFGVVAILLSIAEIWKINRPVDVVMSLNEASVRNVYLPPLKDLVVTLILENEIKRDTLCSINENAKFMNIPHYFIGKDIHVSVARLNTNQDMVDLECLDTVVKLTRAVSLNIYRNTNYYGKVFFTVWDQNKEKAVPNTKVTIDCLETESDSNGVVMLDIPLQSQKEKYNVTIPGYSVSYTLPMPCGDCEVVNVFLPMKNNK